MEKHIILNWFTELYFLCREKLILWDILRGQCTSVQRSIHVFSKVQRLHAMQLCLRQHSYHLLIFSRDLIFVKNDVIQEKNKSNNKETRVEHVAIVGHKGFSSAHYWVEISERASTTLKNLKFFPECITCARKKMLVLLNILRELSMSIE